MRIDLHTHTHRSDGTVSPGDLVRHAHELGMDVLAVTDHDTTEGWAEAVTACDRAVAAQALPRLPFRQQSKTQATQ